LLIDRDGYHLPEDIDINDRLLRNEHPQKHSCMTGPQAGALDPDPITSAKPRDGANSAQREDVVDRSLDQLLDGGSVHHSMPLPEAHEAQDATNRPDPIPETWETKNIAREDGKGFGDDAATPDLLPQFLEEMEWNVEGGEHLRHRALTVRGSHD
jgi:hypothetical protein